MAAVTCLPSPGGGAPYVIFDGTGRGGELHLERHDATLEVNREVFDKAAGHNVGPQVRIQDARKLPEDLAFKLGHCSTPKVGNPRALNDSSYNVSTGATKLQESQEQK